MFIGHFALGFAATRPAPGVSLAALFAAAQFADLLWPVLVAAGVERVRIDPGNTAVTPLDFVSYPYSHSLSMLVAWGIVVGLTYRALFRTTAPVIATLALLVVSHWVLDWLTHRPDMPLYPGGPRFGLGLWNSVVWTVILELGLFAAGVWVYLRNTRARDGIGRWSLFGLIAVLLGVYAMNLLAGPPPSVDAVWITGIAGGGLLLWWSWWTDRHRERS